MSVLSNVPTPAWSDSDKDKICFFIRLAALYHNESGSVADLAMACGLSNAALHMAMKRGQVSGEIAVRIEATLGRDLFPWELLKSDVTAGQE